MAKLDPREQRTLVTIRREYESGEYARKNSRAPETIDYLLQLIKRLVSE